MSDQLPRLGGLSEPEKYERLVDRVPGVWWSDAGPFARLHELNALRAEYFRRVLDRKSTRLNSSHSQISHADFCLKKKHTGKQVWTIHTIPQPGGTRNDT